MISELQFHTEGFRTNLIFCGVYLMVAVLSFVLPDVRARRLRWVPVWGVIGFLLEALLECSRVRDIQSGMGIASAQTDAILWLNRLFVAAAVISASWAVYSRMHASTDSALSNQG